MKVRIARWGRPRRLECLSSVRSRSGQPCSLCRAGDLRVHATTRSIHIQLRVAVLRNSPRPASVRSATAPTATAHVTLVAFGGTTFVFLRARRPATTHRAASSRRLRARPIPRCIVAGIPASSPRGRSARASAEPSPPDGLLQDSDPSKPPALRKWRRFSSLLLRVVGLGRRRLASRGSRPPADAG